MSAFGWHIQTTEEAKAMKFAIETMAAAVISERDRCFEDNRISSEEHREEVAQMQAEREELARHLLYSEIGRRKADKEIERLRAELARKDRLFEMLLIAATDSYNVFYGTLATHFVRDIAQQGIDAPKAQEPK